MKIISAHSARIKTFADITNEEGEKSAVEPNNYLTTNNNINKVELGKIIDRSYEDIILDIENFVKEECD